MPSKSRALPGRYYTGYALITLLMVGAMLAYQAWHSSENFRDYHRQLATTSVNGTADEIELLLSELQRSMRLFADEHLALFKAISHNPDDEAGWLLLEKDVQRHFPEYFGMVLTDSSGQVLRLDFDNRVDEMCQQDIHTFIDNGYRQQGYIHPNPLGYHFDVMIPWGGEDRPRGVFFLSFPPDMLAHTLQRIQPPGHMLLLLRTDKSGLIEVASGGTRTQLQRDFFLSAEEQAGILSRRNLHYTRWELVDLPAPGLFRNQAIRNAGYAAIIFLAFLAVGLLMLYQLSRKEQHRQQAEELVLHHQADLAHIDRVNTMGEMASSLAHELNQPLAAISTYCQAGLRLIETADDPPEKLAHALEQASQQSQRAGQIIRRIRRLAGKGVVRREEIALNTAIMDALDFVRAELQRHEITLTHELADDLPAAIADEIQIEQVIINLLHNAIEAMSSVNSSEHLLYIASMQSGPSTLQVMVSDTGAGMDEATMAKIFDTFYSTREDGMGLGLSISRSIVEAHGGQLWAQSVPGNGATFFFTLSTEIAT